MYDQDTRDAPDVVVLWQRTHVARKAGRSCCCCKEAIEPGQKYDSWGHRVDGKFEHSIMHHGAYRYPSGCPKLGAIDRAEAEEQFRRDEQLWSPPRADQG